MLIVTCVELLIAVIVGVPLKTPVPDTLVRDIPTYKVLVVANPLIVVPLNVPVTLLLGASPLNVTVVVPPAILAALT